LKEKKLTDIAETELFLRSASTCQLTLLTKPKTLPILITHNEGDSHVKNEIIFGLVVIFKLLCNVFISIVSHHRVLLQK
jgi:hypothetical protein